jgi:hypothetical protein
MGGDCTKCEATRALNDLTLHVDLPLMLKVKARDFFLLVLIVLAISINIAVSHYHTQYKFIYVDDWLNNAVGLPFGGRALVADLARFVANIFNFAYDGKLAISVFVLIEAIAMAVASMSIIMMARKQVEDSITSPTVLLAYLIFLWQVAYTLFITPVHRYWLSYDVVTLCVTTLGLYLVIANKFLPLLVTVAIGSWNRETTIVLASWYFFYYLSTEKTPSLVAKTLLLVALTPTVKYMVLWSHNLQSDSGVVSLYDTGQLRLLLNIAFLENYRLLAVFGVFGFLWLLLPLAIQRQPNSPLVRCLWSFPIYFLGMMVVGNIHEIRIFLEFIPLVTLVLITGLARRE